MLESAVEVVFNKRVRELGGLSYKFAPVNAGNPDRVVLLPGGRVDFVELKQDGEDPTPIQELWHRRARKLGHRVHVVRGSREARRWTP